MSWAAIRCVIDRKRIANIHFLVEKKHCSTEETQSLEGASSTEPVFQQTVSALCIQPACTGKITISSWDACCGLLGRPYTEIPFGRDIDYQHSHSLGMSPCLFSGLREQKAFDCIVGDGGGNSPWGLWMLFQQKHQLHRQACTS